MEGLTRVFLQKLKILKNKWGQLGIVVWQYLVKHDIYIMKKVSSLVQSEVIGFMNKIHRHIVCHLW